MRNKKKLGTGSAASLAKKKWPLAGHVTFLDHENMNGSKYNHNLNKKIHEIYIYYHLNVLL